MFETAQFNNQARVHIGLLLTLFLLSLLHSTEGKTIKPIHMLYLPPLILVNKPLQTLYLTPLVLRNLKDTQEKTVSPP
jgi:hypothetical protein